MSNCKEAEAVIEGEFVEFWIHLYDQILLACSFEKQIYYHNNKHSLKRVFVGRPFDYREFSKKNILKFEVYLLLFTNICKETFLMGNKVALVFSRLIHNLGVG